MATFKKVQEAIESTAHYDDNKKLDMEVSLKGLLNMFAACVSVNYVVTVPPRFHELYVGEIKKQVITSAERLLKEASWAGFGTSKIQLTFTELVDEVEKEANGNPKNFGSRF